MPLIKIKPLSVNEAFQGRRFKTKKYKDYVQEIMLLLPHDYKILKRADGRLSLYLKFGLSSKMADIDNPIKQCIDCLQQKYGFNDRMIYNLSVEKELVEKGEEYISFEFV